MVAIGVERTQRRQGNFAFLRQNDLITELMLKSITENSAYPQIAPILAEFGKLDPDFYPHAFTTTALLLAASNYVTRSDTGYHLRKETGYDQTLNANGRIVGGLLHDVGKAGVCDDITASLGVMNYRSLDPIADVLSGGDRYDDRPPEIKATQSLHPLVSGFFITDLGDKGIIDRNTADYAAKLAFMHHELTEDYVDTRGNVKFSYPRYINGLNRPIRKDLLLDGVLLRIADKIAATTKTRYGKSICSPLVTLSEVLACVSADEFKTLFDIDDKLDIRAEKNRYLSQLVGSLLPQAQYLAERFAQYQDNAEEIRVDDSPLQMFYSNIWERQRPRLEDARATLLARYSGLSDLGQT